MGSRSRDRLYGDRIRRAKLRMNFAKEQVARAEREMQAAACEMWSARMLAYGGPAAPSPTIRQAIAAGYRFLELKCRRCRHQHSIDLTRLRRDPETDLWRLENAFGCERCRARGYARAGAQMVKLSREPESHIPWYAPEEGDGH